MKDTLCDSGADSEEFSGGSIKHEPPLTQNFLFKGKFGYICNTIFTLQYSNLFVFVLLFYGTVNPMGSCQAQSVYLTTLLSRLCPLSGKSVLCTFFRQKQTTALLESAEGLE